MTSDPLERPRPRRSWFERLAIGGAIGTAAIVFVVAIALTVGYVLVTSRKVVTIENPAEAAAAVGEAAAPAPPTTTVATIGAGRRHRHDDAVHRRRAGDDDAIDVPGG